MTSKDLFAREVLHGLLSTPKKLPTKYIYNDAGSALFEAIMALPEYYLTRAEYQILDQHAADIVAQLPPGAFNLVELGAGNGQKTRILLKALIASGRQLHYYPIDISKSAVDQLIEQLKQEFSSLAMEGLVMDYFEGLSWLGKKTHRPNVVLFLGSNIGNFQVAEQQQFLENLWFSLQHQDRVLIGYDIQKPYNTIRAAYNDSSGVTRDFTLNLIKRMNEELNANFNLEHFEFYATYNPVISANQSFIYSKCDQEVYIAALDRTFHFAAWEPIVVEHSFKFSKTAMDTMAKDAGFQVMENFEDQRQQFVDSLWLCHKEK